MAKKSKKPVAKFNEFPEELYVTHETETSGEGYFLLWEKLKDAIENAKENNTNVALYYFSESGEGHIKYEVTL